MVEKQIKQAAKGIKDYLKEIREKSAKRKFTQSFDLSVNLKNIDFNKPENRFTSNVVLPHGKGKTAKVLVFADAAAAAAKDLGIQVITKSELAKLTKDDAKHLAVNDVLLAEAPLMAAIGKQLGPVLAPRGKMPRPFPPTANLKTLIEAAGRTYILSPKSTVIHVTVGSEAMSDEQVEENVRTLMDALEKGLPKGRQQIASAYLKLTMGPSIRVL